MQGFRNNLNGAENKNHAPHKNGRRASPEDFYTKRDTVFLSKRNKKITKRETNKRLKITVILKGLSTKMNKLSITKNTPTCKHQMIQSQ